MRNLMIDVFHILQKQHLQLRTKDTKILLDYAIIANIQQHK